MVRRSNLDVNVTTRSGAVHGLNSFLGLVARQIIPDAAAVQTYIGGILPVAANLTVVVPVPVNLDLTTTPSPDTAAD